MSSMSEPAGCGRSRTGADPEARVRGAPLAVVACARCDEWPGDDLRLRKWSFPAAAVLLSILVALPLLEVVLRIEYSLRQRYKPSLAFVSDDLGWLPTPGLSTTYGKKGYADEIHYSTNADGFRRFGDPTSPKTKVWAVGDSTTQAYHVSDGQAYYDVLADLHPGLEVFGYGVGGYGTVQQAMVLERFWDRIQPDVVVWQFCSNDLINNDWLLESSSNEHNNHMARPYLGSNGKIELRHPDRRLGWLARRSLLIRRLVVVRSSLRKRSRGSIETELHPDHPGLERAVATTRRVLEQRIAAAPGVTFLALFVPSPEDDAWATGAWSEICQLAGLQCLSGIDEALEAARQAGVAIDGGHDPHWNAAGHEVAGRAIFEHLQRDLAP